MARLRAQLAEARDEQARLNDTVSHLQESIVDLERTLEDTGWKTLGIRGEMEFSREGLEKSSSLCRVMAIANPLIKRGLGIRNGYVFGAGYEIRSEDEDVNAVLQEFLDDRSNKRAVFGPMACVENNTALGTDGNLMLVAFADPKTGRVLVRTIAFSEMADIVCNPDDKDDPWLYLREWTTETLQPDGTTKTETRRLYYPSLTYRPASRPRTIGGVSVEWGAAVYHIKVNALDGWKWGIGDAYAALPWARLYRDFLGDWAVLMKALSQFAFRASTNNPSKANDLRARLARATTGNLAGGNPTSAGATFVSDANTSLEAIPKSGATIDADSGKPLAAMVSAAMGVPVTMLLGDPGVTGARAVAETLDKPTVDEMNGRRNVWSEAFKALCDYAIKASIRAPLGVLKGTIIRDPWDGQEYFTLNGDADQTVDVDWPSLEQDDVEARVKAVVDADSTRKIPPTTVVKLLLQALNVEDVDAVMDEVTNEDGSWKDPYAQVGEEVGRAAMAAFMKGQDPATKVFNDDGSDS